MKPLILKNLKLLQENHKLVSIKTNNDDAHKSNVGYVLGLNEEIVTIKSVTPQGFPDGIITVKTSDIYGIDMNDNYIRRLELKISNLKTIYVDTVSPSFFSDPIIDFSKILLKAKSQLQLIHVSLYRDLGLYGYIKEVGEEEFVIDVFTSDGIYDGISIYLIEDIKNIHWDDEDNRLVNLLIEKIKL